jgi:iron complex transport system ATP-binding protein
MMMKMENAYLAGRGGAWRVDNVSLSICEGEVLALLGPNGAGKSSILKLFSGELACEQGRIVLGSNDIRTLSPRSMALHRAVLPQKNYLAFNFTVREVVLMGRSPHAGCGETSDENAIQWAMEMTDVLNFAEREYLNLSGGEQQRVHLARVLAQIGPENGSLRFLLLDEPTAALDVAHQHLVLSVAKRIARTLKVGVLVILHDLNLAALYADRIAFLKQGRLEAVGLPEDILSAEIIGDVFDMKASVMPHPHRPERNLVVTG